MSQARLKDYYRLTKPGIIYGNALTTIGGFLLASRGFVDVELLIATVVGVALVIGSACVCNNYIDRDIDEHMARTKKRALVRGVISGQAAKLYATALGLAGFLILGLYVNLLVVVIGLIGFLSYVFWYTPAKRRTPYGTLIGTISGATPIVAGYCAVLDRFDGGAFLLLLILVFWQMAHFYSIAIYRLSDYKAAHIPVWPVQKGVASTKRHIIFYACGFVVATILLTVFGYTGLLFAVAMILLGLKWLQLGLQGSQAEDDRRWARKMFLFSLIVILSLSIMLSIDSFLP